MDNDDDSDNSVGGPKRPGADYLQRESTILEDDMGLLLMSLMPELTEEYMTLMIDNPNAIIWKSTSKGAENLILSGAGTKTWDLSNADARSEFSSLRKKAGRRDGP